MEYSLFKIIDKSHLRQLLRRHNYIKTSSLYEACGHLYILLGDTTSLNFNANLGLIPCYSQDNTATTKQIQSTEEAQIYIYKWAMSEVTQTIDFIAFESNTTLGNNGRIFNFNGMTITRKFDYLTEIYAILNYTLDSFSDGGKFQHIDALCDNAIKQINYGACVLDIGVESTNPNSKPMSADEEITKLKVILPELCVLKNTYHVKISIDTYHNETIKWLIDKDIDVINDVSGNIPLITVKQLVTNDKKYIAMHNLTLPANKNITIAVDKNPLTVIKEWMLTKMEQFSDFGIALDNIILDPGIGFGNTQSQAWYILRNFAELYALPCELLLGHSRKSFLTHITNKNATERDLETVIVALNFINKVDYLRIHDVRFINELYPIINQLKMKGINSYDR